MKAKQATCAIKNMHANGYFLILLRFIINQKNATKEWTVSFGNHLRKVSFLCVIK